MWFLFFKRPPTSSRGCTWTLPWNLSWSRSATGNARLPVGHVGQHSQLSLLFRYIVEKQHHAICTRMLERLPLSIGHSEKH
eukprot:5623222-Amphidinium_carterae.1